MTGYISAGSHNTFYNFDRGSSAIQIAVDYVNCKGSEESLKNCTHFSHSYGCSHTDDVGIRCKPCKDKINGLTIFL